MTILEVAKKWTRADFLGLDYFSISQRAYGGHRFEAEMAAENLSPSSIADRNEPVLLL